MRILIILLLMSTSVMAQDSACLQYRAKIDSMHVVIKNLETKNFIANYKIEKVKFYLNIVEKNRTQAKFLRGWVKRAVE